MGQRRSDGKSSTLKTPFLEVLEGNDRGLKFSLTKKETTIGRDNCDLNLNDSKTSSKHSKIVVNRKGIFIADTNSTNGTFVNNNEIDSWKLKHADEIRIGNTRMVFIFPSDRSDHPLKQAQLKSVAQSQRKTGVTNTIDLGKLIEEELFEAEESNKGIEDFDVLELSELDDIKPEFGLVNAKVDEKDDSNADEMEELPIENTDGGVALMPAQPQAPDPVHIEEISKKEIAPLVMLKVTHGENQGQIFPIREKYAVLGRGNVDIKIKDLDISRTHASISIKRTKEGLRFIIKDLDSSNGTYVNGERISTSEVKIDDTIQMGLTIMHLQLPK